MTSINAVLTKLSKSVGPGESVTFTLIKGPTHDCLDPDQPPVPLSSTSASTSTSTSTPSKPEGASALTSTSTSTDAATAKSTTGSNVDPPRSAKFPRVAKFADSVVQPDFSSLTRLYECDVPPAVGDSDEEEGTDHSGSRNRKRRRRGGGGMGGRGRRASRRHWILSNEADHLERARNGDAFPRDRPSSRYEGLPEHNPSHYVLLSLVEESDDEDDDDDDEQEQEGGGNGPRKQPRLMVTPVHGFHAFTQPMRTRNAQARNHRIVSKQSTEMSMTSLRDIEERMERNKAEMRRRLRRSVAVGSSSSSSSKIKANPRDRLIGRMMRQNADGEGGGAFFEDDDPAAARQELLRFVGEDEGIHVDGDGVLGGTNDEEFGGSRRFGTYRASKEETNATTSANRKKSSRASGGDDFYTRDVGAEYEDLDYDMEEQFDDDDQNMGQGEGTSLVELEGAPGSGGGGNADRDYGDTTDDDEGSGSDSDGDGAAGFATKAGYRAYLVRATSGHDPNATSEGEGSASGSVLDSSVSPLEGGAMGGPNSGTSTNPATAAANTSTLGGALSSSSLLSPIGIGNAPNAVGTTPGTAPPTAIGKNDGSTTKIISEMMIKPTAPIIKKKPGDKALTGSSSASSNGDNKYKNKQRAAFDASGQRIIDEYNVRKEIWLNNQQIPLKTLGKIFGINKRSSKERREDFKACIKELCIVSTDPVEGQQICRLKQHYSNMGIS